MPLGSSCKPAIWGHPLRPGSARADGVGCSGGPDKASFAWTVRQARHTLPTLALSARSRLPPGGALPGRPGVQCERGGRVGGEIVRHREAHRPQRIAQSLVNFSPAFRMENHCFLPCPPSCGVVLWSSAWPCLLLRGSLLSPWRTDHDRASELPTWWGSAALGPRRGHAQPVVWF